MKNSDDQLDLFLYEADQGPALEDLPGSAAVGAPRPKNEKRFDRRLYEADRNDLAAQHWAIIAPRGRAGDRQLEAIEPLRRLREEEQRAPVKIYRVDPEMTVKEAEDWRSAEFWPDGTPEDEVPLYALLLGDLMETSAELQHVLARDTLVGRVHFADGQGDLDLSAYAAYAEKVVRHATTGTPETKADYLFYTAPDGTSATVTGKDRLVTPGIEASRERVAAGKLPAASVEELEADTVSKLLGAMDRKRPGVLLSVSHGLGAPRRGWRSEEEQWRRQGAMVVDAGEVLEAEALAGQPFLPGGMWFLLACFGAGTPQASVYKAWLTELASASAYSGNLASVEKSLPSGGQRPFLAMLPQAALASPRGPLAVIGHLDLAWTYGFSSKQDITKGRKERILEPLEKLVSGSRAGVALGKLMIDYAEVNHELMEEYQRDKDARINNLPGTIDPVAQAHRWMLRNDLRGYILLGDPAARLPLAQNTLRRSAGAAPAQAPDRAPEVSSAPAPTNPAPPAPDAPSPEPAPAPEAATRDAEIAPAEVAPVAGSGEVAAAPAATEAERTAESALNTLRTATLPAGATPETYVLAMLRGDEAPRAIAARAGISQETLWAWLDAYRAGGRSRLPV